MLLTDLGVIYQDVLRCLLHANRVTSATSLLVWADKHALKPDPLTSRLILGKILHLNMEQQNALSPQVVFLLNLEPYKDALPQSLEASALLVNFLKAKSIMYQPSCFSNFLFLKSTIHLVGIMQSCARKCFVFQTH